jgi:hypothetical protein
MYLRDAPLQPLHLSSSPLSSATTFLLGLGILVGLGIVVADWPIFVAAGIAFSAFLAARAAVRRADLALPSRNRTTYESPKPSCQREPGDMTDIADQR